MPADAEPAAGPQGEPVLAERTLPLDFFRLVLDPELVTGCAWFEDGPGALDRAQVDGLRRICRRLDLRRGHIVLDAGGGFGAFARLAAREFGASVLALARSGTELQHMRERLRAERLQARVGVELLSGFMPSPASFDRIVSLNLLAATDFPLASEVLYAALRPEGCFLGHFILPARMGKGRIQGGAEEGLSTLSIPALAEAEQRLCAAGLAIAERRSLRQQLEATVEHWRRNLERHLPQARRLLPASSVADWSSQLAAAGAALRQGRLQLQELVATKRPETMEEKNSRLSPG